jgi:3-oxoacyl-[acyl-carrier protein] reductase
MMFVLNGEVCLITGASRGIGRAIALTMGKQGALIVGTSTTKLGAEGITTMLDEAGICGRGVVLDITQGKDVVNVVEKIKSDFGPISILVNNAGIARDNLLLRMKEEEWNNIVDTNLSSVFRVTKACLRSMTRARKGRIINVSSIVGATGNPGQTNYAAAKAGLVGFTKSLAFEVASRGITVNAIAPGFIETDMTASLEKSRQKELAANIPIGRFGIGEDVANLAVFLASSEASYITGQVVHVNGGLYMSS